MALVTVGFVEFDVGIGHSYVGGVWADLLLEDDGDELLARDRVCK